MIQATECAVVCHRSSNQHAERTERKQEAVWAMAWSTQAPAWASVSPGTAWGKISPWSSKTPAVTFSSRGRYSSPSLSTYPACVLSHFSRVRLFATLWTTHQAPLSMGFPRKEYWSGLSFPPPGDLPHPGIKLSSLVSCTGRFFTTSTTWESPRQILYH